MKTIIGGLIRDFLTRLRIDYQEYRNYRIAEHNIKRDSRAIRAARLRAEEKNRQNNRTYYIMKTLWGSFEELTKDEIDQNARRGIFPRLNYSAYDVYCAAVDIVTTNPKKKKAFDEAQRKKKELYKTNTKTRHE